MKVVGTENTRFWRYRTGGCIYTDKTQMRKVQARAQKRAWEMLRT